ncbi:hypothetical protein SAMN04489729_5155 [Amycolatopsis lurida]|uniref:hypothetical protein n=1 Tax=Amycolatopsis lurida TaxID=31959 RepID=UPI0008992A46|nr:hypothetical protein [Amycolatopsis lurida]SED75589.1 hypothetical protein SAMN04489729_5155 [Amycolatopsis lurida]
MLRIAQQAAEPGWWQVVPAVIQSAFWVIVGTVTVLTYRHARKTVLQPLRTEFFKRQIDELADLLKYFVGLDETSLRKVSGHDKFFEANVVKMYDVYAMANLSVRPKDLEARPYGRKFCPLSVFMMRKDEEPLITSDIEPVLKVDEDVTHRDQYERHRLAWEAGYKHREIHIPKLFAEFEGRMNSFIQNPYMPRKCVVEIEKLLKVVEENFFALPTIIEQGAERMSEHYPTLDDIVHADTGWLYNLWNDKLAPLDLRAKAIIDSAREHLASDDFIGLGRGQRESSWKIIGRRKAV